MIGPVDFFRGPNLVTKDLREIFRDAGYSRKKVNRQLQELIRQNKSVMEK